MPVRSEMRKAVAEDYPHLPMDFIDLVLDLHETDPEYIERLCKEEKKRTGSKRAPEPKRQLTVEEFEALFHKSVQKQADS